MADNVVALPQRETYIWRCECGCATFWLHSDGNLVGGDAGGWQTPDESDLADGEYETDAPHRDVVMQNTGRLTHTKH